MAINVFGGSNAEARRGCRGRNLICHSAEPCGGRASGEAGPHETNPASSFVRHAHIRGLLRRANGLRRHLKAIAQEGDRLPRDLTKSRTGFPDFRLRDTHKPMEGTEHDCYVTPRHRSGLCRHIASFSGAPPCNEPVPACPRRSGRRSRPPWRRRPTPLGFPI
jgi:hypothetical protein